MSGNDKAMAGRYGNYRRILFCSDFSENADFAFDFAVDAALRNPGCTLYLLHVLAEPGAQFWKTYIYNSDGDPDAKAKADIDARIASAYLPRLPVEIDFQKVFKIGKAAEQILAFAAEQAVDLVVLGRQGKGAVRSIFFGDVAAKVARNATCPLLIIPMAFARRQAATHP
jgi:nucleotide-binding universal stress UspA family protein